MIWALVAYAPLLLITLAIEGTVLVSVAPPGLRRHYLTVAVALNLLTHPTVTLLAWRWGANPLLLELFVFLFEWLVLARLLGLSPLRAAWIALLANGCSAAVGFALWVKYLF